MNFRIPLAGALLLLLLLAAGCRMPLAAPELMRFHPEPTESGCVLHGEGGDTLKLHPGSAWAKFNAVPLQLPEPCGFSADKVYSLAPATMEAVVVPLLTSRRYGFSVRKIAVDPGHGGHDSGAVGKRYREKELNLTLARAVAGALEKAGFQVFMTRNTDVFLPLDDRVTAAEKAGADLFLSVHHNASARNPAAAGTESFTLRPRLGEARCAGGTLLATLIQSRLAPAAGGPDRGVKFADFRVLRKSKIPAALIEAGFLSNPDEERRLNAAARHEAIAAAVASAVLEFSRRQRR